MSKYIEPKMDIYKCESENIMELSDVPIDMSEDDEG